MTITAQNTIEAVEYDAAHEITATEHFPTVAAAFAWCNERRGEDMEPGDTEFGYVLMTEADGQRLSDTNEYPAKWYEVHGVEQDGQIRYLEESEYPE